MGKINQTKTRTLYYKLKDARNQARNYFYARKATHSARPTVEYLNSSTEKELCITIAFNTPWTIDLLIDSWGHYCSETRLLVADNSNNPKASKEIRKTCKKKTSLTLNFPRTQSNTRAAPMDSHSTGHGET